MSVLEVDEPPTAEPPEATPAARLDVQSLLEQLREAQAQHGLRHGDYERYRHAARARAPDPRALTS
jgi:hypothetical protein